MFTLMSFGFHEKSLLLGLLLEIDVTMGSVTFSHFLRDMKAVSDLRKFVFCVIPLDLVCLRLAILVQI